MKTQFMGQSDINCLSEFDPAPFILFNSSNKYFLSRLNTKKMLGLIRPNNLRSVSYGLIKKGGENGHYNQIHATSGCSL